MENKLVSIVKENSIDDIQSKNILSKFEGLFSQATEWEKEAKSIVVKDENDVESMEKARTVRISIKKIRTEAENTRKELKESALRYGKAVDGIANVIKALIVPLEEYLEKQEKFVELAQIEKAEKIKTERISLLSKYVEDPSIYNIDGMQDEVFNNLLSAVKGAWEKKQEEIRKAEEDRIKDAYKTQLFNERLMAISPYHDFYGDDTILTKETTEEEFSKVLKTLKERKDAYIKEQKEKDAELARIKAEEKKKEEEHKKQLEKERLEREKLQNELKEKERQEKERLEKERLEKEEKEEKERQAKLAPEKEKLTEYAEVIRTIKSPEGLSKAGLEVVKMAEEKLLAISQEIKIKIKEL